MNHRLDLGLETSRSSRAPSVCLGGATGRIDMSRDDRDGYELDIRQQKMGDLENPTCMSVW